CVPESVIGPVWTPTVHALAIFHAISELELRMLLGGACAGSAMLYPGPLGRTTIRAAESRSYNSRAPKTFGIRHHLTEAEK
ncbi:MAG TPA: hypothetical protein VFQ61_31625, partial [Polyangiaceae bacterium]|nr:hypothetical protein [Polyangiaceae bacterium]